MSLRGLTLPRSVTCVASISLALILGCGGSNAPKPKNAVATSGVKGTVTIDGQPTGGVLVYAFNADKAPELGVAAIDGVSPMMYMAGRAITENDGKFSFTTYNTGDGLPDGNYVIAFFWTAGGDISDDGAKVNPPARPFNKKYAIPGKSEFKITVQKGKPVDEKYDLTTK